MSAHETGPMLYNASDLPPPVGHYSRVAVANGLAFVSGQLPINAAGRTSSTRTASRVTASRVSSVRAVLVGDYVDGLPVGLGFPLGEEGDRGGDAAHLPRFNIAATLIDQSDTAAFDKAITARTQLAHHTTRRQLSNHRPRTPDQLEENLAGFELQIPAELREQLDDVSTPFNHPITGLLTGPRSGQHRG